MLRSHSCRMTMKYTRSIMMMCQVGKRMMTKTSRSRAPQFFFYPLACLPYGNLTPRHFPCLRSVSLNCLLTMCRPSHLRHPPISSKRWRQQGRQRLPRLLPRLLPHRRKLQPKQQCRRRRRRRPLLPLQLQLRLLLLRLLLQPRSSLFPCRFRMD